MQATLTQAHWYPTTRGKEDDPRGAIFFLLGLALVAALPAAAFQAQMLWLFVALAVAVAVMIEPLVGLYAGVAVIGLDTSGPNTAPLGDLFSTIPVLKATPVELLLLWTTFAAYLRTAGKDHAANDRAVLVALLIFLFLVLQAMLLGVSQGGSFTIALWEVRAMLCILPVMLMTNLLVRDREGLRRLGIVLAVTLILMSVEAAWRYLTYIRPGSFDGVIEFTFGHETSVLVGVLLMGAACWALWGPNRKQRLLALALIVAAGLVEITMRRRAGLIAAEAGILAVGLMLFVKDYRRFLIIAPIFLLVSTAYLAVFWHNTKSFGEPARAFRSVIDSESSSERDRASDEYRRIETLNIWSNIESAPIEGIGFGVPYAKPHKFPNLSSFWPFWDYIPHNTILWLWMKAGVVTFLAFWFLLGSAIVRTVAICRMANDRLVIAMAAAITAFFPMMVLFSYVDLGLTNVRLMILSGICFGLVGLMQRLASTSEDKVSSEAGVM
ncbi:MAG TPA: O-antigen ligase family protein [Dehalococcoidia bacterium]|nr:O-antigen ligase family protein [Dehalococcoidia bacterium]